MRQLEVLRKYFLTSVVLATFHNTKLQVFLGLLACFASVLLVGNAGESPAGLPAATAAARPRMPWVCLSASRGGLAPLW